MATTRSTERLWAELVPSSRPEPVRCSGATRHIFRDDDGIAWCRECGRQVDPPLRQPRSSR